MRAANEQLVLELVQRIAELTTRVAELTRRVELSEGVRGNGARAQKIEPAVFDEDDSSSPIEYLTENGFSIVRVWEANDLPVPNGGSYCFRVSDPYGHEREAIVEISNRLVAETELHTRDRIQLNSSFWICCAERRLAHYVTEHDDFPRGNKLIVDTLDCEEVLLSIRWEKSG